jgi:hypothetical protein
MVQDAIPDAAIDNAVDLRQQLRHLRRVLRMAFRHRGGDNPTLGIHPDMQFPPAFVLLLTMLLSVPCALTTHLQARAIDDQVDRSLWGMIDLPPDDYRSMASRQRRMIRTRKRQIHQAQDRAKQSFGLAQGQAKEQPQGERGFDGNIGIDGLGDG